MRLTDRPAGRRHKCEYATKVQFKAQLQNVNLIVRGPIELACDDRIIVTFPGQRTALLDGLSVEVIALQLAVEELSANAMGQ